MTLGLRGGQAHGLERVRPVTVHRREEHEPAEELVNARVAEHEHLIERRPLVHRHHPSLIAPPSDRVGPRSAIATE